MERNILENVKNIKQSISTEEEATREEDIIIKEIFLNLEQVIAIQREQKKTNLQTILDQISMDIRQCKETLNSNIEVILTGLDTALRHLKELIEDLSNTLRPNRL
jgi:actin-like ATPase involved in cell morphogenesis